jgi:hypothetical protein
MSDATESKGAAWRSAALTAAIVSGLAAPQAARASGTVGNGGDAIVCADVGTSIKGLYSLDYLLTVGLGGDAAEPAASVDASLDRIAQIFWRSRNVPEISTLQFFFSEFRRDLYNTTDDARYNFWIASPGGLSFTDDQKIPATLPANCKTDGVPNLTQAFVRTGARFTDHGTETNEYRYVPDVLERLAERDPVQLSFLLVHEWLWNVSHDVVRNREIVRFLHSKAAATLDSNGLVARLEALGLNLERLGIYDDERLLSRGAYETANGYGATADEACLGPRREVEVQKGRTFRNLCLDRVTDPATARVGTTYFHQVVRDLGSSPRGHFLCAIGWDYACVEALKP